MMYYIYFIFFLLRDICHMNYKLYIYIMHYAFYIKRNDMCDRDRFASYEYFRGRALAYDSYNFQGSCLTK